MQNRYVGDLSDFGKYGLLRFLSGMTRRDDPGGDPRLGVIWMLHHDERHGQDPRKLSDDGRHLAYLERSPWDDKEAFRRRDPELWEHLRDLVFRGARCVHCVEHEGVLPQDCRFYGDHLDLPRSMTRPSERVHHRRLWWERAMERVAGSDLVCIDPDNSINSRAMPQTHARSNKFVYVSELRELRELWERGHSLAVYHHTGMTEKAPPAVRAKVRTLRRTFGPEATVVAFLFHGGTAPAFFVVTQPGPAGESIRQLVAQFTNSPWTGIFDYVAV